MEDKIRKLERLVAAGDEGLRERLYAAKVRAGHSRLYLDSKSEIMEKGVWRALLRVQNDILQDEPKYEFNKKDWVDLMYSLREEETRVLPTPKTMGFLALVSSRVGVTYAKQNWDAKWAARDMFTVEPHIEDLCNLSGFRGKIKGYKTMLEELEVPLDEVRGIIRDSMRSLRRRTLFGLGRYHGAIKVADMIEDVFKNYEGGK